MVFAESVGFYVIQGKGMGDWMDSRTGCWRGEATYLCSKLVQDMSDNPEVSYIGSGCGGVDRSGAARRGGRMLGVQEGPVCSDDGFLGCQGAA